MTIRNVKKIVNSVATMEGEGFLVNRPFPTNVLMQFDPFLLLDEMGPKEYGPGEAKGAPDHPTAGLRQSPTCLRGAFSTRTLTATLAGLGPATCSG